MPYTFTAKGDVGVDGELLGKIAVFILALLQPEADAMLVLIHEREILYEMMIPCFYIQKSV